MNFIVYSQINARTIGQNLGMPEYSFYFLVREYEAVLKKMGQVYFVEQPKLEVDAIFDECTTRGEPCVFLSFSPPHKTEMDLRCPTICVFAWEFSTIPNEVWDDEPRNDWRTVFAAHGRAITLATYTADVVKKAMGEGFPVLVWPIPVWERLQHIRSNGVGVKVNQAVSVDGLVIDSHETAFSADTLLASASPEEDFSTEYDLPDVNTDYRIFAASDTAFHSQIGKRQSGSMVTDGNHDGGFLLFGPYCDLNRGRFKITVSGQLNAVNSGAYIDAVSNNGLKLLGREEITLIGDAALSSMQLASLVIDVAEEINDLEIRIHVPAQTVGELCAVEIAPFDDTSTDIKRPEPVFLLDDISDDDINYRMFSAEECQPIASPVPEVAFNGMEWLASDEAFFTQIGKRQTQAIVVDGQHGGGYLLYGPYCSLSKGTYELNLKGHLTFAADVVLIDVVCQQAQTVLVCHEIPVTNPFEVKDDPLLLAVMTFDLPHDVTDLEIRVHVPADTVGLLTTISVVPTGEEPVLEVDSGALKLSGVVYTAVFNPTDARKNWDDLLSAFIWTFREINDAVLVLKFTHRDFYVYRDRLLTRLSQLSPYQCRVVCIHAYLDDDAYADLIRATTYHVNTSVAEGLCIPLLEFLSCGVPVVAPQHTAMLDYINGDLAFSFETQEEPAAWPHDHRDKHFAKRHRTNWMSLCDAYIRSYDVAQKNAELYQSMSQSAITYMRDYASTQQSIQKLNDFLAMEAKS